MAILPGSRTQELLRNLPDMIRAARELARRRPDVRFAVACLHERHKAMAERIIAESGRDEGPSGHAPAIEVFAGRTPELIRLARIAWAVSGSVGLELMADGLPSVVLYKVKRFDLWVARLVHQGEIHQPGQPPGRRRGLPRVPDLARRLGRPGPLGVGLARTTRGAYARTTSGPRGIARRVAQPGATDRAAERIVAWLS